MSGDAFVAGVAHFHHRGRRYHHAALLVPLHCWNNCHGDITTVQRRAICTELDNSMVPLKIKAAHSVHVSQRVTGDCNCLKEEYVAAVEASEMCTKRK